MVIVKRQFDPEMGFLLESTVPPNQVVHHIGSDFLPNQLPYLYFIYENVK